MDPAGPSSTDNEILALAQIADALIAELSVAPGTGSQAAAVTRVQPVTDLFHDVADGLIDRTGRFRLFAAAVDVALSRSRQAMYVVADGMRLCRHNGVGGRVLERGDGLVLTEDGRISAVDAADARRLQVLCEALTGHGADAAGIRPAAVAIHRASGHVPYVASIAAFPPTPSLAHAAAEGRIVILVKDPEFALQDLATRLRDGYGLTEAECRVVAGLVEGFTAAELGARFGVTVNTVQTQVRTASAKMGVHKRSALVSLCLSLVTSTGG